MSTIAENLGSVRSKIEKAALRAGTDPKLIKLVAATKDVPIELIEEAIAAGLTDIGENRVQEAQVQYAALKKYPLTWHMIGHLQTNKVKPALEIFSVIQSVDSEKLAREISNKAAAPIEVFIEVNTSGEESKFGIDPGKAVDLARAVSGLPNLKLTGLMTIGPNSTEISDVRKSFRMLKIIFEEIKALNLPSVELKYLSMGMSGDFETAIKEGSNVVRIGRAIFGIEHKHV